MAYDYSSYKNASTVALQNRTSQNKNNEYVSRLPYPIVNSPFIDFTVLSPEKFSLTWSAKDNAPDYFTSLTMKRYVSAGNVCTINVSYVPRYGEDTNTLERAIYESKGKCEYQYGMAGYRSSLYAGIIYDYTVNTSNGVQDYTINLIGGEATTLNQIISDSQWDIPDEETRVDWKYKHTPAPAYMNRVVNFINRTYLNNQYEFIDELTIKALNEAGVPSLSEGTWDRSRVTTEADRIESAFESKGVIPYRFIDAGLSLNGKTPFEAIKALANHLISYNSDEKTYDPSINYYIEVICPTTNSKGKIRLFSTEMADTAGSTSEIPIYAFDWNHRDSTVLSWKTEYRGVGVITSLDIGGQGNDDVATEKTELKGKDGSYEVSSYDIPTFKDNAIAALPDFYKGTDIGSILEDSEERKRKYRRVQQYPYKASLEVMGVPDQNFELGNHIQIMPYMNGVLHHTGGEYMVIGIDDTIANNGFTTKLELVKIINQNTKALLDIPEKEHYGPTKPGVRMGQGISHSVGLAGPSSMNAYITEK